MKPYRMFRSENGGVMLQHPEDNDALADGKTLKEALRRMSWIENVRGLKSLQLPAQAEGELVA